LKCLTKIDLMKCIMKYVRMQPKQLTFNFWREQKVEKYNVKKECRKKFTDGMF
jgi:septum formation topological specificity factor MinE